jgi:hypothetical protein
MSLLREIQSAAIDSNTDLANLLRKCKVLALRLGSNEFKEWVDCELSGYKSVDDLPEYRIFRVNSKGHFSGNFGRSLKNADIPMICIPDQFRDSLSHSNMMKSVAYMEKLVAGCESGLAEEPWNPDFVALIGQKIYEDMNCMQAWKVIPISAVVGTLDEIQNRILNFVLEIEAEDPEAGEAAINSQPVPEKKLNQIFNTYITGSVQNVATGSHSFEQTTTNNETNSELFRQILEALQSLDATEIMDEITDNVESMKLSQGTDGFKEDYQKFMSLLADHMQVLGPVMAPFLSALAAIVT